MVPTLRGFGVTAVSVGAEELDPPPPLPEPLPPPPPDGLLEVTGTVMVLLYVDPGFFTENVEVAAGPW
jgi:hypothetical protein